LTKIVPIAGELCLHSFKHGDIDDRLVRTGIALAPVIELSQVKAIAKKISERTGPYQARTKDEPSA
jgi:hypothetical protein